MVSKTMSQISCSNEGATAAAAVADCCCCCLGDDTFNRSGELKTCHWTYFGHSPCLPQCFFDIASILRRYSLVPNEAVTRL